MNTTILQRCKLIKKHFGENIETFIDAGCGAPNQEADIIHNLLPNVSIFGFEASIDRYNALKETYPGSIYNTLIGDNCDLESGFIGGAEACKAIGGIPLDSFRKNITKAEDTSINDFKAITIKSTTLDTFCSSHQLNKNIFIWADIEGCELKLLKGSLDLLRNKSIIGMNLEISNVDWFPRPDEILNLLSQYNIIPIEPTDVAKGSHRDILFKLK